MFGFLKSGSKSESENNAAKSADIDILHDIRQKLGQNDDAADISDSDFEDHFHEFAYSDEGDNVEVLDERGEAINDSVTPSHDEESVEPSIASAHAYNDADQYSSNDSSNYSSNEKSQLLDSVDFDVHEVSSKIGDANYKYNDIMADSSEDENNEDEVKYKNPFTDEHLDSYNDADFSYTDYDQYREELNASVNKTKANKSDEDNAHNAHGGQAYDDHGDYSYGDSHHEDRQGREDHDDYDLNNITMTSEDLDEIDKEMSTDSNEDESLDDYDHHENYDHQKSQSTSSNLHASNAAGESTDDDMDDEFEDDISSIDEEDEDEVDHEDAQNAHEDEVDEDEVDDEIDEDEDYDVDYGNLDEEKEKLSEANAKLSSKSNDEYAVDAGGYEDEDDSAYALSDGEFAENSALSSQLSQKTSEALGKLVTKLVTTKVSSWLDAWLNENLPDLVHNIVEEKISAMISDEELEKLDAQNHHMGLHSNKQSNEESQS